MTLFTRKLYLTETRRLGGRAHGRRITRWEAWVEGHGKRFEGRTKDEAVGRLVLNSPVFRGASALSVRTLDAVDLTSGGAA
jgi:hypothetical protein